MKVFCTLIEFAFINFVDVFIRRLKMKDIERAMILKEVFYQGIRFNSEWHLPVLTFSILSYTYTYKIFTIIMIKMAIIISSSLSPLQSKHLYFIYRR